MTLQLQSYIDANGRELRFGRKVFTVLGLGSDGDIAAATVKAVRATYSAVRCNNMTVFRRPGAEAWAILGNNGRNIATFAVHEGQLIELS
jgi:hypothetical protein